MKVALVSLVVSAALAGLARGDSVDSTSVRGAVPPLELVDVGATEKANLSLSSSVTAESRAVEGVSANKGLGHALGIQKTLTTGQFAASSSHGNNWNYYGPQHGRLHYRGYYGGWLPRYNRAGEWIQVDLGKVRSVGGFAIQGRAGGSYWVRSGYIQFSTYGGNQWENYQENGHRKMFNCNWNYHTIVKHVFQNPFRARYVRFVVNQFNSWPVVRWELYAPAGASRDGQAIGLADTIPSSKFQASTAHGNNWSYYGPRFSRLHSRAHYGGWIPQYRRAGEWIQVDLGKVQEIGAVATQGRAHGSYWVTQYYLSYSEDGSTWKSYGPPKGGRQALRGNDDYYTVQKQELAWPFKARFVRLTVDGFHGWPVLRWELYHPEAEVQRLGNRFGISTGAIGDGQLRASSAHGNNWGYYGPRNARLYGGHSYGAWIPRYNRAGEWVQADLGRVREVGGVATQGRRGGSYWVTSYHIVYSTDNRQWTYYSLNGNRVLFKGNDGRASQYNEVVRHVFDPPFLARYVRIVVNGFHSWPCLRWELYGVHKSRDDGDLESLGKVIGIEDGTVANSQLTASSEYPTKGSATSPAFARLNSKKGAGGWVAKYASPNQWIQVDIKSSTREIGGIAIQGRNPKSDKYAGSKQFVTAFRVYYSKDGKTWVPYKESGGIKNFRGNLDATSVRKIAFKAPFVARYVRIRPIGWFGFPALRFELYDTARYQKKLAQLAAEKKRKEIEDEKKRKEALAEKLRQEKIRKAKEAEAERKRQVALAQKKRDAEHAAAKAKTAAEKKKAAEALAAAKAGLSKLEARKEIEEAREQARQEKLKAAEAEAEAEIARAMARIEDARAMRAKFEQGLKKVERLNSMFVEFKRKGITEIRKRISMMDAFAKTANEVKDVRRKAFVRARELILLKKELAQRRVNFKAHVKAAQEEAYLAYLNKYNPYRRTGPDNWPLPRKRICTCKGGDASQGMNADTNEAAAVGGPGLRGG